MVITRLVYNDITHISVNAQLSVYVSFTLIAFFIVSVMIIFLLSFNAGSFRIQTFCTAMCGQSLLIQAHSCPFAILEALLALMFTEPAEPLRRKVCLQVCSGSFEKSKILAMPGWNVTVTPQPISYRGQQQYYFAQTGIVLFSYFNYGVIFIRLGPDMEQCRVLMNI